MADKKVAIELLFQAKTAKVAAGYVYDFNKSVDDMTKKLKNADFSAVDTALSKFQRGSYNVTPITNSISQIGQTAKLSGTQVTQLSYQLNDAAVQLAGGQNPFLILLQQGSQITPVFGGIKNTITTLLPLLAKWSIPLAAAGAAAAGFYAAIKVDEKGNEAAKKFSEIADAAKKAHTATRELLAAEQALINSGASSSATARDDAVAAINTFRNELIAAKKAQQELTKDRPSFAKRLSVPGPGENPFQKAAGFQTGKKIKTVSPPDSGPSSFSGIDKAGLEGLDAAKYKVKDFKLEVDKLEVSKKRAASGPPIVPKLSQTNADLSKGTDLFSILGIDVRNASGEFKAFGELAVEVAQKVAKITDSAKRIEIDPKIEQVFTKFSDLVKSGNVDALKQAFSGKPALSAPDAAIQQGKQIQIQAEQNAYKADNIALNKGLPFLDVAAAARANEAKQLDAEASKITLFESAWIKAAEAKRGYYAVKNGEEGAAQANPITSAVLGLQDKAFNASNDAMNNGTKAVATSVGELAFNAAQAAGALKTTTDNINQVKVEPGILTNAISAIGQLALEAANAAGALKQTAAAANGKDNSRSAPGMATGGFVSGPGSGTSDSVPAWLSNGEYVVRASRVRALGVGFLHAINGTANIPSLIGRRRFADGGLVGAIPSGGSGGGHTVNLTFDGQTFGPLKASGDVIDQLERANIKRRLSSTTTRAPSRIG
jgi:hypothetical protein